MPSPSISICNVALAEVRAPTIVSLDDATPEAKACAIHYPDCLNVLLESHDWGFAIVRTELAALAINDRENEWGYAYALPSDCVNAHRLVDGTAGVGYSIPVWYGPDYEVWWPGNRMLRQYVIAGGTVYSNLETATLEYVSNAIDDGRYPASFSRALSLALAARLSVTLLDDRAKKGDFIQQYEAEKRRAMADDMNRYPRHDRPSMNEVGFVRGAGTWF